MAGTSQRVAKNTIVMYIRMLFLMCIAFYSSRLLLSTLGVEDFGLYSVVGSITSSFVALKAIFSESVQRFLNFEKGKGLIEGQREIYSISVIIHILLAVFFAVVVEVVGLWLIHNKLSIPVASFDTAVFVFHMTVLATVISIISIPFDAVIIANEKMSVFAFVSVTDAILRLIAVLLLPYVGIDRLKAYSLFLIAVPVFTLLFNSIYCRRFEECRFGKSFDKSRLKELLSFSGWNFFGNIAFSLLHEGVNMLLNIFGGLIYNASRSIAYQVRSVASQLTSNTVVAVRPVIMQKAATVDSQTISNNINTVSRMAFFTILLPVLPILAYCKQLLGVWLVDVPEFAVPFTQIILISVVIRSLHEPLNMLYMAVGRIKRMMLIEVAVMLLFLFIVYLTLNTGGELIIAFVELAVMEAIIIVLLAINAKYECGFSLSLYLQHVIAPFCTLTILSGMFSYMIQNLVPINGVVKTILMCCIIVVVYCITAYFFLDKAEKEIIKKLVKKIRK